MCCVHAAPKVVTTYGSHNFSVCTMGNRIPSFLVARISRQRLAGSLPGFRGALDKVKMVVENKISEGTEGENTRTGQRKGAHRPDGWVWVTTCGNGRQNPDQECVGP